MTRRALLLACSLAALAFPTAASAAGEFAFVPGKAFVTAEDAEGTTVTEAGAHPFAFKLHFELETDAEGLTEGGEMRDVLTDLPPGLFGNPTAVPTCPRESFEGGLPSCLNSTQVGVLGVVLPGLKAEVNIPLYNLVPPPGVAAQLGSSAVGFTALLSASAGPKNGYAVHVEAANLPLEASAATATIWGVPADPRHNPERGSAERGDLGSPPEAPEIPFFTLPTSCLAPPLTTIEADSKLAPGAFIKALVPMSDKAGNPQTLAGCEVVPFKPTIASSPSSSAADSASGLGFRLKLPNEGLTNPKEGAVTETEPMKTEVVLPVGITANPAAVNGQGVCTLLQYQQTSCPESAKLGTISAQTPLLEEAIEGSVYLAAPHDNPFNSLLALYIIARAPARGILVKQAGRVEADPATGRLTTTIDGLPPVPYSGFEVRLREGPRAPLITPQACATYTTTARLYPFSDPGKATVRTAPFTISSGAGGGPCASSEAGLPNHPALLAGTTVPVAGAYSPFLFKLSREDGSQRFGALTATLPEGLTGKLAGIPYCSEAQIAAAAARTNEGEGTLEAISPSCPATSQVGTLIAGAGAGAPYYVQGKAYLAGPYKGAPLSLAIITPAIAGPFDLGVVVARAALAVNESTARITAISDPLPTILHGFPLDLRSVSLRMDRSDFTLNPTSCEEKQITVQLASIAGSVAPLQNRFQVSSCKGLGFGPKLSLSLKGATRRSGHPAFKAALTQPSGQANIGRTSVALPPTEFIDQDHIANPCTRPQFAAANCPSASLLGKATAYSPLLDKPLTGNVYFRANGGERDLPDVVADLKGQVHLVIVGYVDSIHKKGSEASRVRATFATVPDAPVSKFVLELKGGKKHGLLVNSTNICKTPNQAIVKMRGQNGRTHDFNPKVATSCKTK